MIAAEYGRQDCVSILVANKADVNIASKVFGVKGLERLQCKVKCLICWNALCSYPFLMQGEATALMIAAEKGHPECVSIFVANGADVNTKVIGCRWCESWVMKFLSLSYLVPRAR